MKYKETPWQNIMHWKEHKPSQSNDGHSKHASWKNQQPKCFMETRSLKDLINLRHIDNHWNLEKQRGTQNLGSKIKNLGVIIVATKNGEPLVEYISASVPSIDWV